MKLQKWYPYLYSTIFFVSIVVLTTGWLWTKKSDAERRASTYEHVLSASKHFCWKGMEGFIIMRDLEALHDDGTQDWNTIVQTSIEQKMSEGWVVSVICDYYGHTFFSLVHPSMKEEDLPEVDDFSRGAWGGGRAYANVVGYWVFNDPTVRLTQPFLVNGGGGGLGEIDDITLTTENGKKVLIVSKDSSHVPAHDLLSRVIRPYEDDPLATPFDQLPISEQLRWQISETPTVQEMIKDHWTIDQIESTTTSMGTVMAFTMIPDRLQNTREGQTMERPQIMEYGGRVFELSQKKYVTAAAFESDEDYRRRQGNWSLSVNEQKGIGPSVRIVGFWDRTDTRNEPVMSDPITMPRGGGDVATLFVSISHLKNTDRYRVLGRSGGGDGPCSWSGSVLFDPLTRVLLNGTYTATCEE